MPKSGPRMPKDFEVIKEIRTEEGLSAKQGLTNTKKKQLQILKRKRQAS